MSENITNIELAQIEEERRIELENLARSVKLNTETLLDDSLPFPTRIRAIEAAECLIRRVVDDAPDDGVERVVYPHFVDYLKGLINIAGKPMSEENFCSVLKHIHIALCAFDLEDDDADTYQGRVAPFATEICTLTIQAVIKFRTKLSIVKMCNKIFKRITHNFESEECKGIILESGLIPILANMIFIYSTHKALPTLIVEDAEGKQSNMSKSDRESFVTCALCILYYMMQWCLYSGTLPISILVETALTVFDCVLNSTTKSIISSGYSVILQFLETAGKETIGLMFVNGRTGLQYILLTAAHILDLSNTSSKAICLQYLAVRLIEELQEVVGENFELGEGIDEVLNAALNAMKNHTDGNKNREILMLFSHLIRIQCDAVLNFLAEPAGSTGQDHLDLVIFDGLCKKYESFDVEDRITVKLALKKIYEYAGNHPESQLHGENIEGEGLFTETR